MKSTQNRSLLVLTLALLGAIALIPACGSDSGTEPHNDTPSEVTISLAATTGDPMSEIGLNGLTDQMDPADLWTEFTDPQTGQMAESMVLREGNAWTVLAPPHPGDPFAGGATTMRVTDGSKLLSNTIAFTIAPLPESPGAFGTMVDDLSSLLSSWLALHGTSRAALDAADPGQLTDQRAPLYLAYEAIDMPGNPNSLRAIAEGTSPLIEEFDLDPAQLDAAIGISGLGTLLTMQQARVDSLDVLFPEKNSAGRVTRLPGEKAISVSAGELNDLMWKAQLASILNGQNGQQILTRAGQAMAVVGLHPAMKTASLGVGTGLFGYAKAAEAAENLYPSSFLFSEDDLTLSPTDFSEDEDEEGSWTMQPVATSKGWTVDRAVLEGLVQYAGAGGLGNAQGKVIESFISSQLGQDFAGMLVSEGLNAVIGGALPHPQDGVAEIPPQQWTANLNNLCEAQVIEGNAVVVTTANNYATHEVGTSRLRVSKQDGYFGYQALLRFKNVNVNAIEVTLSPPRYNVDPGEIVYFFAEVENANDTELNWSATTGIVDDQGLTGAYQTPSQAWSGAITVEAESAATGGIRAGGTPRRFAGANIYCAQIEITPAGICLEPGATREFIAEVSNYDEPYEIDWDATAGFFSGSTYNAPGSPVGQVTITARIVGTEIQASVGITVDECICQWAADLGGSLSGSVGGEFAAYQDIYAEGESGTNFSFRPGSFEDNPNFFVTAVPAIGEFETGSWPVLAFYVPDDGESSQWISLEDEELGTHLPTLTITANSGDSIQGTISGDLVKIILTDPPQVLTANFSLEFSAKRQASFDDDPCQ